MPSTVPQSQHMEFWLRDKGLPTQHTAQGHTHTQRSPDSINSPKRIELPGPPIHI